MTDNLIGALLLGQGPYCVRPSGNPLLETYAKTFLSLMFARTV